VGCPRIHGELLKLGFEVAQSSAANMVKRCEPPSQRWRTFLRNHAPDIAPWICSLLRSIGFDLLYVLIIIRLERRNLVWINVTPHPTAEWIARQITEAFPWNEAPQNLIRDRDRVYGAAVTTDCGGSATSPSSSPWQNGFAERLIGSIRRECVDHMVVLSEARLRLMLTKYAAYYNDSRTHRFLGKDAPIHRAIQHVGRSNQCPYSADFIIIIAESNFRYRQEYILWEINLIVCSRPPCACARGQAHRARLRRLGLAKFVTRVRRRFRLYAAICSRLERGRRIRPKVTIYHLAQALGVRHVELIMLNKKSRTKAKTTGAKESKDFVNLAPRRLLPMKCQENMGRSRAPACPRGSEEPRPVVRAGLAAVRLTRRSACGYETR
jgi:Integrase core domain